MHRLRMICAALCISLGLLLTQAAGGQSAALKDQIALNEQKLAEASARQDKKEEAILLNRLATLYRQSGDAKKALNYCYQALTLEEGARFHTGEALTKDIMARIYTDTGDEMKALDILTELLPFWQSGHNRRRAALFHETPYFLLGEASTLNNLGTVYNNLGEKQKALEYFNQALPVWQEAGSSSGQASALDGIGRAYADMGQGQEALGYFSRALPLWRAGGELGGEGLTLCNMGKAYADLGQKRKALEAYNHSLDSFRQVGNREGEADALNYRGKVYADLGQEQTALDDFNQALSLWRATGTRSGEALALDDIGRVYFNLGQNEKALDYYNQALPIWHQTGNRRGEAATLSNQSRSWSALGDQNKALETGYASLSLWREVKDSRGQAFALNAIGKAYFDLGQPQKALSIKLAALALAKQAGDPDIEGGVETSLMSGFRDQHRREEAIFFGMEAVNSYQSIRKNLSGLDKDLQAAFAQSRSKAYRILAELLVEAGRLGEAEQILDLLKEEELNDVVRGAEPGAAAKVEPFKLPKKEKDAENGLAELLNKALAFEALSVEFAALQAKTTRTPDEETRLKSLPASIDRENDEIFAYFASSIYPVLEREIGGAQSPSPSAEDSTRSYLQNTLAKLGPGVMGIRLLLGERHVYAIIITANARKKVELKVTPAELRSKAFDALQALGSRSSDPRPQLNQLYAVVVSPLEEELKTLAFSAGAAGRAPTLLWSLDDALRYLPMAALYDGQHYLIERFNNVLFTPESYGHMADASLPSGPKLSVLALGLSKSYGGLPALPGVIPELEAVVRDPAVPASHGPMDGRLLPDEKFTLAALKSELGAGKSAPVVHIASHFVVDPGGGEPYLMLGGEETGDAKGYVWSLSDMEKSPVAFHGTHLLTLSACSTAKDYKSRDGVEMDSLGMIAQQKDAEAVLATLWDVNDISTSRLMSDFYARWLKKPAAGKAEALRQAQLELLRSAAPATGAAGRGFETISESPSSTQGPGYAHPYYWAPFVLIGNYR